MIDLDAIKARLARVAKKWPTTGVLAPGADEFGPRAWAAHGPLRCHATEQGSARGWKQANADADLIAHAPGDIAALIAEVELLRTGRDVTRCYADRVEAEVLALRAEASLLQQEARIHRGIGDGLVAEVEAARAEAVTMRTWAEEAAKAENENAEDAKRERAAVVEWLRDNEDAWHMPTWQLADKIERGEHRREEGE